MDSALSFVRANKISTIGLVMSIAIFSVYLFYNPYTQTNIGTREEVTFLYTKDKTDTTQTAQEMIAKTRLGSIMREFPEEFLDHTIGEIEKLAKNGNDSDLVRKAKKALKLLKDGRFKK